MPLRVPTGTLLPSVHVVGFFEHLAREGPHERGETEASLALMAVMHVLREHITPCAVKDVLAVLPDKLKLLVAA